MYIEDKKEKHIIDQKNLSAIMKTDTNRIYKYVKRAIYLVISMKIEI